MKHLNCFLDYLVREESLVSGIVFGIVIVLIGAPIAAFVLLVLYYAINYAPWLFLSIPLAGFFLLGREIRNYIKETKQ